MSYDIDFRVKVEGVDDYVSVGDCDANITWNVRKIIELSTWRSGCRRAQMVNPFAKM